MKYVYKIISAICSLAVLPAMVFTPIIYYHVSSVALQSIFTLAELLNSGSVQKYLDKYNLETVPEGIADTASIYDLINLISRFNESGDSSKILESIEVMIPLLIATGIALVFVILCAILTVVFAFACKDNRKVIATSLAGLGFSLMLPMLIENTVAPILSGEISMSTFIDAFWASLIAEVEEISVAPMYYFIPVLFAVVVLWTMLYNATLPEKEKAARKKMIG